MRTFDLTPLYRSTVGFDRLFSMLDQGLDGAAPGYPPYNIERTGDNEYRVTVAVAGFAENELSVVAKENTLTIRGEKNAKEKRSAATYSIRALPLELSSALSSSPTSSRSRAPSLRTASCTSTSCARFPRRRSPARSRSATATRPSSTKRRPKRPGFEIRCNAAPRFSGALFVGRRLRRPPARQLSRSAERASVCSEQPERRSRPMHSPISPRSCRHGLPPRRGGVMRAREDGDAEAAA
jgi:hypothetical protein